MVGYKPVLHPAAQRELDTLDEDTQDRLTSVLADLSEQRQPAQHEKVKSLAGQKGLYRVRIGDVRAVYTLEKPELRILTIGKRKNVYEIVDDLDSRRASA